MLYLLNTTFLCFLFEVHKDALGVGYLRQCATVDWPYATDNAVATVSSFEDDIYVN